MIGFIDKLIEGILKRSLHKKRDAIYHKALNDYIDKHNPNEETIAELTKKLEDDIDRIMTLADRSVIHANMLRARYVFWITAIIGTAITLAIAAYPVTTSIVPFFVPLMAAFVGWAVAVGTIPVSYIHTAKGVMDASVATFEKEQLEQSDHPEDQLTPEKLDALRKMIEDLKQQLDELSRQAERQGKRGSVDFDAPPVYPSDLGLWRIRRCDQENVELMDESLGMKKTL